MIPIYVVRIHLRDTVIDSQGQRVDTLVVAFPYEDENDAEHAAAYEFARYSLDGLNVKYASVNDRKLNLADAKFDIDADDAVRDHKANRMR